MKSDTTTTVLTFVLFLLVICGVFFAILTMMRTSEFRKLNIEASRDKDTLMRVQNLAGEVNAYNQKNPSPGLTQLLQAAQAKPGNH
jgi:hypothetical protein